MTAPNDGTLRLRSKWALVPGGELARDVSVEIERDRILGVSKARASDEDLGDVLVAPGLVNAHTHLELSGMPQVSSSGGFARWALWLGVRRALSGRGALARSAGAALDSLMREGVTCIGELATVGAALEPIAARGLSGVWYRELIDPRPSHARDAVRRALSRSVREAARSGLRAGLFPHAPYSTSAALNRQASMAACAAHLGFATHVSETPDEMELFDSGSGSLVGMRRMLGMGRSRAQGVTPIEWLARAGALRPGACLVHATHATAEDVEIIRAHGASVVVCPSSADHLSGGPVDVARLLREGVAVGIGTDSPASGGLPSLRREMTRLATFQPGLPPSDIWRMATECGAQALGMGNTSGRLAAGALADIVAVEVPDDGDPLGSALHAGESRLVIHRGVRFRL